jgi:WhiB family redox-sensing transcriptional regulator
VNVGIGSGKPGGFAHVAAQTTELEWQIRAACRGPQAVMFFPPSTLERRDEKADRERRAKAICSTCSVKRDCLGYALRIREPHGIWGGLNELERRSLLAKETV